MLIIVLPKLQERTKTRSAYVVALLTTSCVTTVNTYTFFWDMHIRTLTFLASGCPQTLLTTSARELIPKSVELYRLLPERACLV